MTKLIQNNQHGPSVFSERCFPRMIDFRNYIFLLNLHLFNKLRFTPKVSLIVYLNWCIAHGSATIRHKRTLMGLTLDHFSAQVLFKTYMSYSWACHSSYVGTANPSRLQLGSLGARRQTNLGLHYTRAIDYFRPVSPCRPVAIVQEPLCPHIISFTAQMKTAELY